MGRRGGGAGARDGAGLCPHAQENLRDPDPDAKAAKEKDFHSDEKEIAIAYADTDARCGKEIFPEPHADVLAATEEKTFADTEAERNSDSNAFGAIKEKTFAHSLAERDSDSNSNSNSKSNAFAHTDSDADARNFPLRITEKAWRAQREPESGPNQRLRKLSGRRSETSRRRPRPDQAQS